MCLGDEHAVERVSVRAGQRAGAFDVVDGDVERRERLGREHLSEAAEKRGRVELPKAMSSDRVVFAACMLTSIMGFVVEGSTGSPPSAANDRMSYPA